VPLGEAHLELVAVVDAAEAAQSPFGRWVAQAPALAKPLGWAIRTPRARWAIGVTRAELEKLALLVGQLAASRSSTAPRTPDTEPSAMRNADARIIGQQSERVERALTTSCELRIIFV
jgi:hypothetical protein